MFNMYQELVDRINELLKENRQQKKLIEKLKRIYLKIPYNFINDLVREDVLTYAELNYWLRLRRSRRDKENDK